MTDWGRKVEQLSTADTDRFASAVWPTDDRCYYGLAHSWRVEKDPYVVCDRCPRRKNILTGEVEVIVTNPNPVKVYYHRRLGELAQLKENWDSYGAPPVSEAALATADALTFIPTGPGGVQLELHSGGREVEITIDEDGVIEAVWISGGVSVEQ